jgi:hypothetical protein
MTRAETLAQYGNPTPNQRGLGNINLDNRSIYVDGTGMQNNPLGSPEIRTENSATIEDGLGYVNIPTVINGKQYPLKDAIDYYRMTGQHLGKFNAVGEGFQPWSEADANAEAIHLRQQSQYTK